MERNEELLSFGGKFQNLLFSNAQENLQGVDFLLIYLWNYKRQYYPQSYKKCNTNYEHDYLCVHIRIYDTLNLYFSRFKLFVHLLSGNIAIKFQVIDFELLHFVELSNKLCLCSFAFHSWYHVCSVVDKWQQKLVGIKLSWSVGIDVSFDRIRICSKQLYTLQVV